MMKKIFALIIALLFAVAVPMNVSASEAYIIGDVDGDGEVTIMDATNIQRYLAELEVHAPIGEHKINDYEPIELNFERTLEYEELDIGYTFKIYDTRDLTPEILKNRADNNVLIVERVIGKVTDGYNGRILNTDEEYYNYISYKYADFRIAEGTIVLSYMIYNPNNNEVDDIVNRYDYVLDRSFED